MQNGRISDDAPSSPAGQLVEKLHEAQGPLAVEVAGGSMSPSLEVGWLVRIVPLTEEPIVGNVVLVRTAGGFVIHRVVAVLRHRQRLFVIQKGDAPGWQTLTPGDALAGKATSVLRPEGRVFPDLEKVSPEVRARFEAARRACRPYIAFWTAAHRLGLHRVGPVRRLAARGAKAIAPGAPLFSIRGSATFRLDLPVRTARPASPLVVREVGRHELVATLRTGDLPEQTPEALDLAAGRPWRCFVAFDRDVAIAHAFVAARATGPHLFGSRTVDSRQGQGVRRTLVRAIADALSAEGHAALTSSCSLSNVRSMRAHAAAGFVITRRRRALIVLGIDVGSAIATRIAKRRTANSRAAASS